MMDFLWWQDDALTPKSNANNTFLAKVVGANRSPLSKNLEKRTKTPTKGGLNKSFVPVEKENVQQSEAKKRVGGLRYP